jgi:hypothetical protein
MRYRVTGRNEETRSTVTREVVCDTEVDAEAFAVFEGIVVERIEPLADSPEQLPTAELAGELAPPPESEPITPAKEPELPTEFGHAPLSGLPAPLDDPLRALRGFFGVLMVLQIVLTGWLYFDGHEPSEVVEASAGSILLSFAFWRLLPSRPVNAFYLRSFRHDAGTWSMRKSLSRALGREFRLSGIRDPRRRSIKLLRYLSVFILTFRYVTPKYMNLEAGADWKRRLWRSLARCRLAIIDVTNVTPFVAEEIRLCFRCLGPRRILFVGDAGKTADGWNAEIEDILDRPAGGEPIHGAIRRDLSPAGRRDFEAEVRRFASKVPEEPAGPTGHAFPMDPASRKIKDAPVGASLRMWAELIIGMGLAVILWSAFKTQLRQLTRKHVGYDRDLDWIAPLLLVALLGLLLYELWLFVLYVKDCTTLRERCLTIATFGLAGVVGVGLPIYHAAEEVRATAAGIQSKNDLKHLALGLYGYIDDHKDPNNREPPLTGAAICDRSGKPLLSWRVAVLHYLEQDELYNEFHLDEPWDSPHNLTLVERMPRIYTIPRGGKKAPPGHTFYRVFVSAPGSHQAMFVKGQPITFWQVGHQNNTLFVVEAADAVPWTKPDELEYDSFMPIPPLGGHFRGGFQAVRANAQVDLLREDLPEAQLRKQIERDDGEGMPGR